MSISFLDILAPHYCCSCGAIGAVLCEYCKYDIVNEPFSQCFVCLQPTAGFEQLCSACHRDFTRGWCVGWRTGSLEALVDAYKFQRVRAADTVLASLCCEILPNLPDDVVVVPIPTIAPHVRARGYGHIERVAKQIAKKRHLPYREVLRRQINSVQHGATKRQRAQQAAKTFYSQPLDGGSYLLVDDVYTTGATMKYAAKVLKAAGADEVWVMIISRQPLEK